MINSDFYSGRSDRGRLVIASCTAADYLATAVEKVYSMNKMLEMDFLTSIDRQFSDSETNVRLEHNIRGSDVYLFQTPNDPTSGFSINDNLMSFLIAIRAFKEHGAKIVTGIYPYLAYARQDKPTRYMREPVTIRLMADLMIEAGLDQLVTWDPHRHPQGFFGKTKVDTLDSLQLFIREFQRYHGQSDVIVVAPDEGASKFVQDFADGMNLSYALAEKHRPEPGKAKISNIVGDFMGKRIVIILDDMIASAGSMYSLVTKIATDYNIEEIHIGASHNLCLPQAFDNIIDLYQNFNLKSLVITNSIPQTEQFANLPFIKIKCLSEILAKTINCIHYDQSVSNWSYHPNS